MKKSWLSLLLTIIHISVLAQNVGIGTNAPLEKLSVGNSSQFRVDANGILPVSTMYLILFLPYREESITF